MIKAILEALKTLIQEDNLQWMTIWFLMFNTGKLIRKVKNLEGKK